MKTRDAIDYFGSVQKLMLNLGITSRQAIYAWGETPPYLRQVQIEHVTNGKLKADRAAAMKHRAQRPA